jgi:hypothetical protein
MMPYVTKHAPSGVLREPDPISNIRPSNDKDIPTITISKNNHQVNHRSHYRQSTLNSFLVPKQSTPINQTISIFRTPSPPQKQPINTSLRFQPHDLKPHHLQFSISPLPTSNTHTTINTTASRPATKQLKITTFFYKTQRSTAPPSITPAIKPTRQPKTPIEKRNAIRQKLLTYHLHSATGNSQKPLSQPLPKYDLLDSWGHSLPVIDCSTVFHIFLQNPNGISLNYNAISLRQDLHNCKDHGPVVICLPETNVNWNRPDQYTTFKSTIHCIWINSVVAVSRPPEDFLSQFQPGGTSTIICDNWVSRILDKGEDPIGLGRWSYITLHGKASTKVTVIRAYNASYNTGDATNYHQQEHTLTFLSSSIYI